MVPAIIISIMTCLLLICSILFFPKIKIKKVEINSYWIVCLIGAFLILIFNSVTISETINGLFSDSVINPIKILLLFFSMTFLSIFLDEVGLFQFLATVLIGKCRANQKTLFLLLYIMVAILTIFTSNDIVILTFTPFICYFSKNAKINPIPYLVAEFAAANTYSMILVIGNPTNIYLATSLGIDFISYFKVMAVPTLICGLIQLGIMLLLFRKRLNVEIFMDEELFKIKSKLDLTFGLGHLLVCLVLLIVSSYWNLEMWIICLICAFSLMICIVISHILRHKKINILLYTSQRLPFNLIPFVLSMFVIVLALNKQGVTEYISSFFGETNTILKYGVSSFFASNLINNIPMSVLFSNIISSSSSLIQLKACYSTIIGSNLGAFLTPIGALAGIMFTDLVHKQNISFSFLSFIKYGVLISLPTLIVALSVLSLFVK